MLKVYNTFISIQGESTFMGLPCFFIRLAGCPLHCSYCDTRAACDSEGTTISVLEVVERFKSSELSLVEVTGGEPLIQKDCWDLLRALSDTGKTVLLETGGSISILGVDSRVRIIMDVKCPDSLMNERMDSVNLKLLKQYLHELKFVVSSKEDFEWAVLYVHKNNLYDRELLVSPVINLVSADLLAEWILVSHINFRLQLQLHKQIWTICSDDK